MNPKKNSKQQQIFDPNSERAGWGEKHVSYEERLNKPNPPTPNAVNKAQFKDKTYQWIRKQ